MLAGCKEPTPSILREYGAALTTDGQVTEGIAVLRRAASMDPQCAQARVLLGNALCSIGDHRGALEVLQEALEIEPLHHVALTLCGAAHLHADEPCSAVPLLQEALELEPQNEQAAGLHRMAQALAELELGRRRST